MISIPYYTHDHKINLTRPLPNPYEGWSPLEMEDEMARHTVAFFSAKEADRELDAQFHEHQLDLLDREIRQQQAVLTRNALHRRAMRWPDHRQRFKTLRDIAQNLKRDYPLATFIASSIPGTALRRVGKEHWLGHCPLGTHEDKNPSFHVYDENPQDRHFHCYACGAHGDIFELLNYLRGYPRFEDRVRIVADAFGSEVKL